MGDNRGHFIVVEGIEGSGKSTLIKGLEEELIKSSLSYKLTREPGGTSLGKKIREILLTDNDTDPPLNNLTELLLFFADRAQHIKEIIKPSLSKGEIVLCDRYFYSTLAYQHYGRGIDRSLIDPLLKLVVNDTLPDIVLLVDIEPEEALKRAKSRANLDRIEKEDISFHIKIREGFLALAKENKGIFHILDGKLSPKELQLKALEILKLKGLLSSCS